MAISNACVAVFCLLVMTACGREAASTTYSMASVNPVVLQQQDGGLVQMDFKVPPETIYYVPGVDYRVDGDTLSVSIVRCRITRRCKARAELISGLPPGVGRVRIPSRAHTVVVHHADGEQVLQLGR